MSILEDLKNDTRPEHVALEKELNLLRADLTIEDYKEVIKKFYGFYKSLETKVSFDPERRRVPNLEDDLRYFRINPEDVPVSDKLPALDSESHIMGVMYVLEGSTLGGTFLTKHFKEKFGLSPGHGLSYFSGYGDKTFLMWKDFQNRLLTFSESKSSNSVHIIISAKSTFELLRHWLVKSK